MAHQGSTPTGLVLWVIWLLEAAMVVGIAALCARAANDVEIYCEPCDTWCPEEKGFGTSALSDMSQLRPRLEARSFDALAKLGPRPASLTPCLRWDLHSCPRCAETNALTLNEVTVAMEKGKAKVVTKPVLKRLILSGGEAAAIKQMARGLEVKTPPVSALAVS